MKQKRQEQPERRRALAEINLIGQKGVKAKTTRRGCVHIFGVMSVLIVFSGVFAIWVGLR